jgi:hypothetical protein
MNKIVIAGSASLQKKINKWRRRFIAKSFSVLDYPVLIPEDHYPEL